MLKEHDKSLSKYKDLKDIPKEKLKACVKELIRKNIKKILECGNDKDKIKAQILAFRGMLAEMPNDQYVMLMETIKDIFDVKALRTAVDAALNRANNPEDCKNGNLNSLIQYLEKMGKKFGLNNDEVLRLLSLFEDIGVLKDKALSVIRNARNSFETPEERETFDQIQLKISEFYNKHPEKAKDSNYVLTAEDLRLKTERELKVFEKIKETLNNVASINAGIIGNKNCETKEEDKLNAQNSIIQELINNGFDTREYNKNLRNVIDEIIQKNPEFFDNKSIEDVYDLINKYTSGKFGEDTGCYGNQKAESFNRSDSEKSSVSESGLYDGLGFNQKPVPSSESNEYIQSFQAKNNTEKEKVFEYVGIQKTDTNDDTSLLSVTTKTIVSNSALFTKAWAEGKIKIDDLGKNFNHLCNEGVLIVKTFLRDNPLYRKNKAQEWGNSELLNYVAQKDNLDEDEIMKLKGLDMASKLVAINKNKTNTN